MILLKKIQNGKDIVYESDSDVIHPFTNKPIKKGDFQYLLVDKIMYNMMKIHMTNEIEFVKEITEEVAKSKEVKVKVIEPNIKKEAIKEVKVKVIKPKVKAKTTKKKTVTKRKRTVNKK